MGNKRTYRSVPEARFVKRALETASGKNIDDAISKFDKITYNSDTNTFEIGTDLYVDGNFSIQADLNTYGGIQSFNDSSLSFYQYEDTQSSYFDISPLFGQYELSFTHFDGQAITATATLKMDGDCNILTNINVKTLFGNQSIYGSGNIDLYKHYLTLTAGGKTFRGVILSSNNLDCTGVGTKLITLLKCTPGETHYYEHFLDMSDTGAEYALYYNGSILQLTDGTSDPISITNVVDKPETV